VGTARRTRLLVHAADGKQVFGDGRHDDRRVDDAVRLASGEEQGEDSLSVWDLPPWFCGFVAGALTIALRRTSRSEPAIRTT
jgi:hypothetical protein